MGNALSNNLPNVSFKSRKRKNFSFSLGSDEQQSDENESTPKRRKLMCTTKYIYKTLFEEGQGSDVKIIALGKVWNLHRVYLSQSPYFNSMFNGLWVETNQKEINIGIEDENITTEALHKVFGSLYQDDIHIEPTEAVSILACATLLQLEDLIQQTIEVMKESINFTTAISFYDASELYGLRDIKKLTLDWFHKNGMLNIGTDKSTFLPKISIDLMIELLSSPKLVVIQTEFSLYLMLKMWVFLKENPSFNNFDALAQKTEEYFKNHASDKPFLLTNYGVSYQPAFRTLRLKNLIVHHVDIEFIEADNIIPKDWLYPVYKIQWYHMLRVDQNVDKGPKGVSKEDFKNNCVRCGRILNTDTQHSWRWTGFNFSFDIVVSYSSGVFKLRRFSKKESTSNFFGSSESVSLQSEKRYLMYKFRVFSVDDNGKVLSETKTPIQTVSLAENESIYVLRTPPHMKFPVVISANFLLTTPLQPGDDTMTCIKPNLENYA